MYFAEIYCLINNHEFYELVSCTFSVLPENVGERNGLVKY